MSERKVEELMFWWPSITRDATNPWAKNFARSILRQARNPRWTPSPKQIGIMRRMFHDWTTHKGDDDFEVFE